VLTRLNILLVALLVLCALGLVTSQHRARKLFIAVERAHSHAAAHEIQWNQLQVEQTELAKSARIDDRARRELGMLTVQADHTLHLSVDPASRRVSLSQPWREATPKAGVRKAAAGSTARQAAGGPLRPTAGAPIRSVAGGTARPASGTSALTTGRALPDRSMTSSSGNDSVAPAGKRPGHGAAR
jgi:cell division protein FtsL